MHAMWIVLLSNLYQPEISSFGVFSADPSREPEVGILLLDL
jgi:hypothetical protein